jgi:predicted small lipoprotein YifL
MNRLMLILLTLFVLSACGQKGPLIPPEPVALGASVVQGA